MVMGCTSGCWREVRVGFSANRRDARPALVGGVRLFTHVHNDRHLSVTRNYDELNVRLWVIEYEADYDAYS
jgi:hypothetical protein